MHTSKESDTRISGILDSFKQQARIILLGKFIFTILGIITSILLARVLGPRALGQFYLGLAVIHICSVFTVAGFDKGFIRFIPILEIKNPSILRTMLRKNNMTSILISIMVSVLLYYAAPILAEHYFHSDEMIAAIRNYIFYLPVLTLFRVSSGAVTGFKRADIVSNVSNILAPMTFLISILIVYWAGLELKGCIFGRATTHLLAAIVLFVVAWKMSKRSFLVDEKDDGSYSLRKFISFSAPVMMIGLIYFLLGQMDLIMLGYFVTDEHVGIYTVAVKLTLFIIVGLEIALPMTGPRFSELSKLEDFETFEKLFKLVTKWILYLGLIVFTVITVMRIEILSVYGKEFAVGGTVLIILGIGQLLNAVTGPTGQILVMTGKQRWEMSNSILMVVVNFVLNILLIPKYGLNGAAVATGISISSINIMKIIEVYIIYRIHPYNLNIMKGIAAIAIGGITCYYGRLYGLSIELEIYQIIIAGSLIFSAVTFTCFWIFGFDREDKFMVGLRTNRISPWHSEKY